MIVVNLSLRIYTSYILPRVKPNMARIVPVATCLGQTITWLLTTTVDASLSITDHKLLNMSK